MSDRMAYHTQNSPTIDGDSFNGIHSNTLQVSKGPNDSSNTNLLLEAERLIARIQKHAGCGRDEVVRILREIFV
jgi:phage repressor protein C with HTH and peptisase S24 domain